ncbi:hypothetical protein FRC12_011390 [Ceratobasidium sp. 428]|nr:hypothetical protein FRC12_011390 [Ceratobasidium sp. 428]
MRRASGYGTRNQDYHHRNDNVASDYSQNDQVYSNQHTYSNQPQKPAASRNLAAKHGFDSRNIAPPAPHRAQTSSIARSGTTTPSRLPSALRAPRTRSYTSSSSTNSHTTAEETPPLPQNLANRSQVSTGRTREDISTNSASRANTSISSHSQYQSGLPRRSASASRSNSRSRSRNDYSKPDSPPPLPESHSGSDGTREIEPPSTSFYDRKKVPNMASWAKDRRRFASLEPSSGDGDLLIPQPDAARVVRNYEQPPTQAPPERRSSLAPRPPLPPSSTGSSHVSNRSRIPSAPAKPNYTSVENKTRNEPSSGSSRPKSSQIGHLRRPANSNIGSLDRSYESTAITVAGDLSQGQRHRDASESKPKPSTPNERNSTDAIHISSMKDMPLPTPLFPQSDLVPKNRRTTDNRSPEDTRPRTISSPLETMLMGSNPDSTPNTKRMSTLVRTRQELSTYVPTAPTTPRARRYSEPSPGGGDQSSRTPVRDQTPKEQEAPPTILQRLVRRASFSAGKSPKSNSSTPKSSRSVGTPKNQAEVEHYDAESPFGLDVDTPRATTDSGTGSSGRSGGGLGVPEKDLSHRERRQQSGFGHSAAPPASTSGKKPRSKAIDNITGAQDGVDKLGSPFMGDGSPRFGIDERFKSPRLRSKSRLRNDVSSEAREEDSQDLFDYYTSDDTGGNDEEYFLEDTPVATVLASPGDSGHGGTTKSSIPPSPMARSKKRSQYQHAGGIYSDPAELVNAENRSRSKPPGNDSLHTPRDRTPSRVTFSPVAPDTVREGTRSSSQSSGRSQISDLPMGREPVLEPSSRSGSRRQRGEMSKPGENVRTSTSPARSKLRHSQRDSEHTTSDSAYTQPSAPEPDSVQSHKDRTSHRVTSGNDRAGNHNSQLSVPKARKTNSALFRALEQPYYSSPFSSNPSTDVSSNSLQSDSYDIENGQTDDSTDQLHTVPSNLSSLNGDKVGDIRWSGTHELSRATDVLFHNINHSDSGMDGPQVVIEEPSDAYLSDVNDSFTEPAYSDGAEYEDNRSGLSQQPVEHSGDPSFEGGGRRMSMQDKRKAIHESWRASLEGSQFGQPEDTFDPMELERQQAIWEFHESEEAYVDNLQLALRLFVQPLRTQNQRQWISGLAPDVMRLFDWLDDITNLHHQLLSALDALRMKNQSFLIGFSDSIRPFIPLMELYQPYVVRVEEVGKHIMAMALDPDSDFGEFIRMQSALPECDQESLEDMLAKPAKRLQDYVDMFQVGFL